MKYMGSKARVANEVSNIINNIITEKNIKTYIEPFVGGSNMIDHIKCDKRIGIDSNKYLIAFWKQIQNGWNPFNLGQMTKDFYNSVKDNKDDFPNHIVALCGLCATYNAKWFGGYAGIVHTKIGTERNYYDEAVRNVLKQVPNIIGVEYKCDSYFNLKTSGAFIYCDPPYEGTTKYKDDFNHDKYWEWVRKMSKDNIVVCSEYNAPSDFDCIWQKQLTTTLDKSSRSKAVEKLFIYQG